ncbi:MAG: DUF4340 domain-containing protein [Chitinispirillia bacterium]|jgi:hypothetical protein
MKTKNLIILGSILLIIVAIIFVTEKLNSPKKSKNKSDTFLPGFSISSCSAFSIKNTSGSVKLRKESGKWLVSSTSESKDDKKGSGPFNDSTGNKIKFDKQSEEYLADSASVQSALEKLNSIKLDDLISQNPEKRTIFEVDTAKGTRIEVWNGQNKSIGVFFIGKNGPDWNSHYVRTHGSNNVYSVMGSIKYSFFTEENRWRDKTILKYDSGLTQKISVEQKDSSKIILEKSVDTAGTAIWTITEPKKAKTEKDAVDKLVNNLADFIANDFEKDKSLDNKEMGFDNPKLNISIELENGDKKSLIFGNKNKDNKYWVRNNESEYIFLVYESKLDDYNFSYSDLAEKKKEEEKSKKGKK